MGGFLGRGLKKHGALLNVWRERQSRWEPGKSWCCKVAKYHKLPLLNDILFWSISKEKKSSEIQILQQKSIYFEGMESVNREEKSRFQHFSNTGTNCSFLNICGIFFFRFFLTSRDLQTQQRESLSIRLYGILVDSNTSQRVSEVHSVDSWKQCVPYSQHLAGGEVEIVVIVLQKQQELSTPSSSIVRFWNVCNEFSQHTQKWNPRRPSILVICVTVVGSKTSQHCCRWNYSCVKEPIVMTSCHAREVVFCQGHLVAVKLVGFFFFLLNLLLFFFFQRLRVRRTETSYWIRFDLVLCQSFLLLELAAGTELVNFLFVFLWKYRPKLVSPAEDLKATVKSRQITKHCRFSDKRNNWKRQNDAHCWPILPVLGSRSKVWGGLNYCLVPHSLGCKGSLGNAAFCLGEL